MRLAAEVRDRLPWRALAAGFGAVALLALGFIVLRGSSFAAVERVSVTGLTTSEAPRVRDALERAGRGMSTLAVDERVLRAAVAPYTSVGGLEIEPDFPHGLRVRVIERTPVALLSAGSASVPVDAGGRLLQGLEPDPMLPLVTARKLADGRLADRRALAAVDVLAVAPAALRDRVRRAELDRRGLAMDLRGGPDLIFGDARRPRAKWAAAARVLADPSSVGAVYLDLRVPERVAAGGLNPVDSSTSDVAPEPETTTLDSQPEVQGP